MKKKTDLDLIYPEKKRKWSKRVNFWQLNNSERWQKVVEWIDVNDEIIKY